MSTRKHLPKATTWLGLALLGLLPQLSSCSRTSHAESRATPLATQPTTASVATPTALPDSLQLTPVPPVAGVPDTLHQVIAQLHRALGPDAAELRPEVLEQACVGYLTLHPTGRIERGGVLAVADMDLPNTTERLWVIDLKEAKVLHRSTCAPGASPMSRVRSAPR
jgi:hypothetical protein